MFGRSKNSRDTQFHEYCTKCEADLTMQKGYSNDVPFWICKGCGQMLINPNVESEDDVAWICDGCGQMLNVQPGFKENNGTFKCLCCGFVNAIDEKNLYDSEDEYQRDLVNPYRGLSDEEVLRLTSYQEVGNVKDRADISIVTSPETGKKYIRKFLTTYDKDIYEFLKKNPVSHMPRIVDLAQSSNCLIVIEEFIEGHTVQDVIDNGVFERSEAIRIALDVCEVLKVLHGLPTPIVHRDIKPSNIMITPEGATYLFDMDAAKWYNTAKSSDTAYIGTWEYAAPEQVGFGLKASSVKTDIYAMGILFNVMMTGKVPKECRADEPYWSVISNCISLDADARYNVNELMDALKELRGKD